MLYYMKTTFHQAINEAQGQEKKARKLIPKKTQTSKLQDFIL